MLNTTIFSQNKSLSTVPWNIKELMFPVSRVHTLVFIFAILCFSCSLVVPVTATNNNPGYTYSITQVSEYKWPAHGPLSAQHDPDVTTFEENLRKMGGTRKFLHKNNEVTRSDFTDPNLNSDIHIHFGHGNTVPFMGSYISLSGNILPLVGDQSVTTDNVKNKWNHKWVILYACHLLEDHKWFSGLTNERGRGVLGFGSVTYAHFNYMTTYSKHLKEHMTIAEAWGLTNRELNGKGTDTIIARVIFQNKAMFSTDYLFGREYPLTTTKCSENPYVHNYRSDDMSGKGYSTKPEVPCNYNTEKNEDL